MTDETTPDEEVVPAPKKTFKTLNSAQWEEAKLLRQRYGETLDAIAKKFGITPEALHRRFKRHNIVKGAHADLERKAIERRIENVAADNAQEMITKSEMIRELTLNAVNVVTRFSIRRFQETIQEGKSISLIEKDLRTAKIFLEMMEKSKSFSVEILKEYEKYDEENLPILTIRKLTDDDIETIRIEQAESDEILGEMGDHEDDFEIENEIVEVFENEVKTVKPT